MGACGSRRFKERRRLIRPSSKIPIKQLPWASVLVPSSAICSPAVVRAIEANGSMDASTVSFGQLGATSKQLGRRLLIFGENRLELLTVEVQEERERLLRAIFLALGVATFSLLSGIAMTAALVVWLWDSSPLKILLTVTGFYVASAFFFYRQFGILLRDWQTLPATLDQLRKDRAGIEKMFP